MRVLVATSKMGANTDSLHTIIIEDLTEQEAKEIAKKLNDATEKANEDRRAYAVRYEATVLP